MLHCNGPQCPASGEDETATSWSAWETCPAPSLAVPAPLCNMAQSQGTFQRHFSNSHYPQRKDQRPAFSSAWLLFRPKFQSSVEAFFQLKEEGGFAWIVPGKTRKRPHAPCALQADPKPSGYIPFDFNAV